MKVIGITGGIGAGKSMVLSYLSAKDKSETLEADKLAHQLMKKGQKTYKKIANEFGKEILDANQEIDRASLAKVVLNDKDALHRLNSIVHPDVKEYIRDLIRQKKEEGLEFLFIEAALLIQDGYKEICNEIWFIQTDAEIRKSRIIESRGYSVEKAEGFLNSQPQDDFFYENTDRVIHNNGDFEFTKIEIEQALAAV